MIKAREATAFAESTLSLCKSRSGRIAIYIENGEMRRAKVGSPVLDRLEANGLKGYVGLYGVSCDPAHIKDDILFTAKAGL